VVGFIAGVIFAAYTYNTGTVTIGAAVGAFFGFFVGGAVVGAVIGGCSGGIYDCYCAKQSNSTEHTPQNGNQQE
jgi:hypothetical protein